jgi:hypothetical protein
MQGQSDERDDNREGGNHHINPGSVAHVGDGGGNAQRSASIIHQLSTQTMAATELIGHMRALVGDDDEMIETAIEGETDIHEALANAMKRLAELEMLGGAISNMMASMSSRKARLEKQYDNIRIAMAIAMETANIRRIENGLGTLSLKSTPPKAEITDEAAIPSRFWKAQDPKLDKRAVLAALKDKEDVPGAVLSNGGQTIQVKFT